MLLESEIVTHQESPVEVTNDGKTAPDDPTDKKIEVTQIEPAEQAKIEVTEVSDTTDAAEIVPTAVEVDAETVTGVDDVANDSKEMASSEIQQPLTESNIQPTNDEKIDENENLVSQESELSRDASETQNLDSSKSAEIVTSVTSPTTSPKPKKNQIAPMPLTDEDTIASAVVDSENIENIPITSPKPKKNQIQPLEILDSNQNRPTSAKSLRNFTNQELFSIGSRANTNISETAIDNWTKVISSVFKSYCMTHTFYEMF